MPGPLPGVGVFEQYPLTVKAAEDDANEAPILLSRYQRRGARPLMLLHGYSASGTTFAHEALRPSFAAYLWHQGWDVWVVDLRSSAGLASSTRAWTFEEIANADIPLAVDHIFHATGGLKISVVAHCMGAAMFSMAVLSKDHRDYPLRNVMKDRIDRVVMTQIGPGMVFSAGNTFRAYIVSYLKPFLPLARFDFRVDAPDSLANQVIDRLLNLLPYPEEEFAIENPAWPPWKRTEFVGLRHRMDLLYGRDFSLGNVQAGFLEHLDAQFGPLNLDTLSQVIAFARWRNITDKRGRNLYFHRKRLQDRWTFDTLSLHGADNGLSSIATLSRNKRIFRDAGVNYQTKLLPGFGHQDIWASPDSEKRVFKEIHQFLAPSPQVRATTRTGSRLPTRPLLAAPPFLGPILSLNPDRPDEVFAKVGNNPNLGPPQYILVLGVEQAGSHYRTAGFNLEDGDLKRSIQIVPTPRLDDNGMIDLAIRVPDDSPDLLVLMVHDEHPDLLSGSFGEPPFSLNHRHRFLSATGAESEPGADARLRDAVCAVMDKAASRLTPAVIPARTVAYRQNQEGGRSDVCVVFASCQFASTVFDKEVAWASYNRLARRLDEDRSFAPGLLLLLGDQVYVDPTAGFADPRQDYDKYIKPHIAFLSNDAVQKVLSSIPTYMMLDDHEIGDNWQPNELDAANLTRKQQGESAFRSFQFNSLGLRDPDGFWGEVSKSPIPVFMLNTRTEREPRTLGNLEHARLISDTQLAAVTGWLGRQAPGVPKIVTFSSLPLPR
ncbi:MAG: alkaline phosphatase D family protein, partial [Pseudomonadales bacterium]